MAAIEPSNQSDASTARRRGPFQDALQPGDLSHHALLRDLPPEVFPWTVRELQRRLYDGKSRGCADSQSIAMRQGFPLWWSAALLALGWFLLVGCIVAGSDLGRGFQLLDGSGSFTQAAAPVLSHPLTTQATSVLAWSGVALLAIALFMALCPRKHFFIVAQRNDSDLIDLWLSGTSWRQETQFDREFRLLARRIESQRSAPESQLEG